MAQQELTVTRETVEMTMDATNLESGSTLENKTMKDVPVVAVIKTARFPKLIISPLLEEVKKTDGNQTLPARLGDARDEPVGRQFADGDTR